MDNCARRFLESTQFVVRPCGTNEIAFVYFPAVPTHARLKSAAEHL